MSAKLKSPFESTCLAIDPQDKRLLPKQADNFGDSRIATQYPKGISGNQGHTKAAGLEKLELKLQEFSKRKRMSYEDALNDVLVRGAVGEIRLTPTQLGALIKIFEIRFGKPKQHESESSGRPILIMNGPTQVIIGNED